MPDALAPQIQDVLATSNAKTIAESASFAIASLMQHHVKHQNRLDILAESHLARALNQAQSMDPTEAVATSKLFKGESDSSIASLLAQVAASQMGIKAAQSTPGDVASDIARLGASVSSLQATVGGLVALLQQTVKGAQSTPPVTGA